MKEHLVSVAPLANHRKTDRAQRLLNGGDIRASVIDQNCGIVCSGSQPWEPPGFRQAGA